MSLVLFLAVYVWPAAGTLARGACPPAAHDIAHSLAAEADGIKGGRLYNSWADGGYLGLVLEPRYRIFWDGRYIFHPLLPEVLASARTASGWQALLDRRGVEVACIKRSFKRSSLERVERRDGSRAVVVRPFYVTYMPRSEWALVFWDAENLVYARRSVADAGWLRRNEYVHLVPDDQSFLAEELMRGRVPLRRLGDELSRHLRQIPTTDKEKDPLLVLAGRSLSRD
jgi:hypothetical protein